MSEFPIASSSTIYAAKTKRFFFLQGKPKGFESGAEFSVNLGTVNSWLIPVFTMKSFFLVSKMKRTKINKNILNVTEKSKDVVLDGI